MCLCTHFQKMRDTVLLLGISELDDVSGFGNSTWYRYLEQNNAVIQMHSRPLKLLRAVQCVNT